MISNLIKATFIPCETALKDAGKKKEEIDEFLLVGGMTRIPIVRKSIGEFFCTAKIKTDINPLEAVAILLGEEKDIIPDVIPV